jgi:hypothetical protein
MAADKFEAMRAFFLARVNEINATQMLVDVDFMRHLLGVPEPVAAPVAPVETVDTASAVDPAVEPDELPRKRKR